MMTEQTETDPASPPAAEAPKAKTFPGELLDKLLVTLDNFGKRLDSMETADKARRADAERADPPSREDLRTPEDIRRGETRATAADSAALTHVQRQDAERQLAADTANAQARADQVYMDMGSRAPAPMASETLQSYRIRLARGLQRFSDGFSKVDLAGVTAPDAFSSIEDRIYSDAMEAASRGPEVVPGVLRELTKVDPHTGQRITTFHGDRTFIHEMKRPSMRLTGIRTKFSE